MKYLVLLAAILALSLSSCREQDIVDFVDSDNGVVLSGDGDKDLGDKNSDKDADKEKEEYLRKIAEQLEAMVKAGKITKEQAAERLKAAEKAYDERMRKDDDNNKNTDDYLKNIAARLKAMVEAGEITPEEARAKYEAIKKAYYEKMRKGKGDKDTDDYLKRLGEKLKAAVESGSMTPEEARAMYEKLKREYLEKLRKDKCDKDTDKDCDDYLKNLGLKLRAAVERGDMTAEEASAMYEKLKREYLEKLRKDKDGKNTDKAKYTRRVVKELVYLDDCDYIVAGTVAYFLGDKLAYTIDYGDGQCDNIATKTVGDKVVKFRLDKK